MMITMTMEIEPTCSVIKNAGRAAADRAEPARFTKVPLMLTRATIMFHSSSLDRNNTIPRGRQIDNLYRAISEIVGRQGRDSVISD
ncbi:MAG: hypothetical protein L0229_16755 [Blastocatellia bacterium]|nr:hypothetical protein [Blastocatellia bacterium]